MKFINVGFSNIIAAERVVSVSPPDSAPMKRLISDAKTDGLLVDVSCGRKTKSVIITDCRLVLLSAISPDRLKSRLNGEDDSAADEEDEE